MLLLHVFAFELGQLLQLDHLLFVIIDAEELLDDVLAVLELWVGLLESQLDVDVVVLVLREAEAISLQGVAVAHIAVLEVDLRSLRVSGLLREDDEIIIVGNLLQHVVPLLEIMVLLHVAILLLFIIGAAVRVGALVAAELPHLCHLAPLYGSIDFLELSAKTERL